MSIDPLSRLNLNHLLALDTLLAERSVQRAAARLALTPSALSHTLAALREALDDPLLVRGTGGLVATARAEAMRGPLHRALRDLAAAVSAGPVFEPAIASRRFVIGMGDAFAATVLPTLLARVRERAPGLDLDARPAGPEGIGAAIEAGDLDLAIDVRLPDGPGLVTRALHVDPFACAVRAGHPEVAESVDLDTYLRLGHVLMSPLGHGPGVVDQLLAERGLTRRVVVATRYFLVAPMLVAATDLILTGPRRFLVRFAELAPLRVVPAPLPIPDMTARLVWSVRHQDDPGHRWLREQIAEVAA